VCLQPNAPFNRVSFAQLAELNSKNNGGGKSSPKQRKKTFMSHQLERKKWGDLKDACALLNMSRSAVYNLIYSGMLNGITCNFKRPGTVRGVRRFYLPGLEELLKKLALEQGEKHEIGTV
jgi:hypothetical protein